MSTIDVQNINSKTGNSAITISDAGTVSAGGNEVVTTQSPQLGRRNLIINGAMQVAQRGTSFTVNAVGVYTVDRFVCDESTDGSLTVSQSTDAPDDFKYSLKIVPASADTSIGSAQYARVKYKPEGYDVNQLAFGTANAKDITLSFYAKSNKTGTYCVAIDLLAGTQRSYVVEVSLTNTWTRYSITIPKNTAQPFSSSTNGVAAEIEFILASGTDYHTTADTWTTGFATANQVNFLDSTSNELYITGVQLEVGDTATPFEHRSYGEELALCHRYYYLRASGVTQEVGNGGYFSSSQISCLIEFPTEMRAPPTLVQTTGTGYYGSYRNSGAESFSSWLSDVITKTAASLYQTGFSATGGFSALFRTQNANAYIAFDAEL